MVDEAEDGRMTAGKDGKLLVTPREMWYNTGEARSRSVCVLVGRGAPARGASNWREVPRSCKPIVLESPQSVTTCAGVTIADLP